MSVKRCARERWFFSTWVEHKPKKKKRGLVRSLALRPSVSSTAGSIAQGFPFPLGFISHNIARRNPKGKGVVMSLEAG